jgi:hypothetical protein
MIASRINYRSVFDSLNDHQKTSFLKIAGFHYAKGSPTSRQDIATLKRKGLVVTDKRGYEIVPDTIKTIIANHLEEIELCNNRRR